MSVSTEIAGSTTLVASNRPPQSHLEHRDVYSLLRKVEKPQRRQRLKIARHMRQLAPLHQPARRLIHPQEQVPKCIFADLLRRSTSSQPDVTFVRTRSVTRTRCGDVYSPVRIPAAANTCASVAAVLPFPLVPQSAPRETASADPPAPAPAPAYAPGRTSAAPRPAKPAPAPNACNPRSSANERTRAPVCS